MIRYEHTNVSGRIIPTNTSSTIHYYTFTTDTLGPIFIIIFYFTKIISYRYYFQDEYQNGIWIEITYNVSSSIYLHILKPSISILYPSVGCRHLFFGVLFSDNSGFSCRTMCKTNTPHHCYHVLVYIPSLHNNNMINSNMNSNNKISMMTMLQSKQQLRLHHRIMNIHSTTRRQSKSKLEAEDRVHRRIKRVYRVRMGHLMVVMAARVGMFIWLLTIP